jgi:hypothetical protein
MGMVIGMIGVLGRIEERERDDEREARALTLSS